MNVTYRLDNIYSLNFIKESIIPNLTVQQKKVVTIASIVFGILAICYLISLCCSKKNLNSPKIKPIPPSKPPIAKRFIGSQHLDGKLYYPDGSIGQGQIRAGMLLGLGTIDHPDGTQENGLFDGYLKHGTILYREGIKEQGDFVNGKLEGLGRRTHPNGTVEKGTFKDGQLIQPTNDIFNSPKLYV